MKRAITITVDDHLIGILESALRADCEWLCHVATPFETDWNEVKRAGEQIIGLIDIIETYKASKNRKAKKR